MKIASLVLVSILFFLGHVSSAQMVKPTPTPVPAVHRHKHKVVRSSDDSRADSDTSKPAHTQTKKKSVKKAVADDVSAGNGYKPSPTPSPEPTVAAHSSPKKKILKKAADDDEDQPKPIPTPTRKKPRKPAQDDEEDADKAIPTPTPSKKIHKKMTDDDMDSTVTPEPAPKSTATPSPASTFGVTNSNSAPNATLTSDQIVEFSKQPENVQKLLESALELTRQNLTYTYGSADPANGGMDCSGFVYYVLRENGFTDVPRDASGQYVWVRKARTFQAVLSTHKDSFELDDLRPGDLLFWTGTYNSQKDPPITHAMIYLGTEKKTHKSVMVGSTDGRTYDGKSRWGVSVFDFKANAPSPAAALADPKKQTHAAFVGYARIPGLRSD